MADVVMVVTMVAFLLLCVAYVGWCDRIIVRDDAALDNAPGSGAPTNTGPTGAPTREEVAA